MKLIRQDDPKYKIVDKGSDSLSDSEVLSVIIGGREPIERARMILSKVENNYNLLALLSYNEIKSEGLSHDQAIRILAFNSYFHRKKIADYPSSFQIKSSRDMFEILSPRIADISHEEFWLVLLNRANKVLNSFRLSIGGWSGTVTDVRLVIRKALEYKASGMIVCHNHPSGNLSPSESDSRITQRIKDAGNLMDIQLLDHIIIARKDYFSFADNGLL